MGREDSKFFGSIYNDKDKAFSDTLNELAMNTDYRTQMNLPARLDGARISFQTFMDWAHKNPEKIADVVDFWRMEIPDWMLEKFPLTVTEQDRVFITDVVGPQFIPGVTSRKAPNRTIFTMTKSRVEYLEYGGLGFVMDYNNTKVDEDAWMEFDMKIAMINRAAMMNRVHTLMRKFVDTPHASAALGRELAFTAAPTTVQQLLHIQRANFAKFVFDPNCINDIARKMNEMFYRDYTAIDGIIVADDDIASTIYNANEKLEWQKAGPLAIMADSDDKPAPRVSQSIRIFRPPYTVNLMDNELDQQPLIHIAQFGSMVIYTDYYTQYKSEEYRSVYRNVFYYSDTSKAREEHDFFRGLLMTGHFDENGEIKQKMKFNFRKEQTVQRMFKFCRTEDSLENRRRYDVLGVYAKFVKDLANPNVTTSKEIFMPVAFFGELDDINCNEEFFDIVVDDCMKHIGNVDFGKTPVAAPVFRPIVISGGGAGVTIPISGPKVTKKDDYSMHDYDFETVYDSGKMMIFEGQRFAMYTVRGDGSCLFRALLHQIFYLGRSKGQDPKKYAASKGLTDFTVDGLRKFIVGAYDKAYKNNETFKQFITSSVVQGQTDEQYLKELKKDKLDPRTYGEQIDIVMFQDLFNITVHAWDRGDKRIISGIPELKDEEIWGVANIVLFDRNNENLAHYNSLIPIKTVEINESSGGPRDSDGSLLVDSTELFYSYLLKLEEIDDKLKTQINEARKETDERKVVDNLIALLPNVTLKTGQDKIDALLISAKKFKEILNVGTLVSGRDYDESVVAVFYDVLKNNYGLAEDEMTQLDDVNFFVRVLDLSMVPYIHRYYSNYDYLRVIMKIFLDAAGYLMNNLKVKTDLLKKQLPDVRNIWNVTEQFVRQSMATEDQLKALIPKVSGKKKSATEEEERFFLAEDTINAPTITAPVFLDLGKLGEQIKTKLGHIFGQAISLRKMVTDSTAYINITDEENRNETGYNAFLDAFPLLKPWIAHSATGVMARNPFYLKRLQKFDRMVTTFPLRAIIYQLLLHTPINGETISTFKKYDIRMLGIGLMDLRPFEAQRMKNAIPLARGVLGKSFVNKRQSFVSFNTGTQEIDLNNYERQGGAIVNTSGFFVWRNIKGAQRLGGKNHLYLNDNPAWDFDHPEKMDDFYTNVLGNGAAMREYCTIPVLTSQNFAADMRQPVAVQYDGKWSADQFPGIGGRLPEFRENSSKEMYSGVFFAMWYFGFWRAPLCLEQTNIPAEDALTYGHKTFFDFRNRVCRQIDSVHYDIDMPEKRRSKVSHHLWRSQEAGSYIRETGLL